MKKILSVKGSGTGVVVLLREACVSLNEAEVKEFLDYLISELVEHKRLCYLVSESQATMPQPGVVEPYSDLRDRIISLTTSVAELRSEFRQLGPEELSEGISNLAGSVGELRHEIRNCQDEVGHLVHRVNQLDPKVPAKTEAKRPDDAPLIP